MLRVLPGNLFEGEWREGKPLMKGGDRGLPGNGSGDGPLDWLNEAVANVASSVGLDSNRGRGEYSSVATYDDDDDDYRRGPRR